MHHLSKHTQYKNTIKNVFMLPMHFILYCYDLYQHLSNNYVLTIAQNGLLNYFLSKL